MILFDLNRVKLTSLMYTHQWTLTYVHHVMNLLLICSAILQKVTHGGETYLMNMSVYF